MTDTWTRLRDGLAALGSAGELTPRSGRVGAALALLGPAADGDAELVLTRRHEGLAHHPGQIAFPGGRVEPGETVQQAALREAAEEVALEPTTVDVLGALPAFYIPPSRFWLQVVVGRWREPHPLVPAEAEVDKILHVRLATLREEPRWRMVRLSARGDSWAWDLPGGHLLWGATAMVTAVLLGLVDPGWSRGRTPSSLEPDREVRPWLFAGTTGPPRPPRLPGVPEVELSSLAVDPPATVDAHAVARAGILAATAVRQLLPSPGTARVIVLAGPGATGAVGVELAGALASSGVDVLVVSVDGGPPTATAPVDHSSERFSGRLPPGDLVVDALVGRGLRGALHGAALDAVLALRDVEVPVVAVDLPSGLHPSEGLVGDTVTADVTLALGVPAEGLFRPGLAPYIGDLYLVGAGGEGIDPLVRVVNERAA